MLSVVAKALNFTFDISNPRDQSKGYPLPSNTWDGVYGEVLSGRAELAIGGMPMIWPFNQVNDLE